MKASFKLSIIAAAFACAAFPAIAAELKISGSDSDTIQTVLTAQKGTRVTVRTHSGQDVTGVVRDVNANVVQFGAVSGKEFFDAVVPLSAVDAVYVRVRSYYLFASLYCPYFTVDKRTHATLFMSVTSFIGLTAARLSESPTSWMEIKSV